MKIFCEDTLLYAKSFFSDVGECYFFSGATVSPEFIKEADILLVRSTTKVNESLLSQCQHLKFVGTGTAGTNHIDNTYLASRGLKAINAGGCNAAAVVEYVLCSMLNLACKRQVNLFEQKVGIVGVGNIGSLLNTRLNSMGIQTELYDPPLQNAGDSREFSSFEEILKCDWITLHVPLVMEGDYPTNNMFSEEVLAQLADHQVLINACRGEVVDNQGLLNLKRGGRQFGLVIDVWNNEPDILFDLVEHTDIATAHIAGHTLEGKGKGTEILYQAVCQQFALPMTHNLVNFLPEIDNNRLSLKGTDARMLELHQLTAQVYDVESDSQHFRGMVRNAQEFQAYRKKYAVRREFSSYIVQENAKLNASILAGLGFSLNENEWSKS
ncbi:4-phosphoerythronate dehydrogenase [Alteromonas sp. a30]|uniref:4-phosphoerythronate dehydrogenase n=1 Tax=Alteromonas sp. a30 TaxID=2730917 RepID=UPI00227EF2B7|nr:4-phosphoerythronate dehydrogenase [Alteromonas sp. a30]MCY7296563.1 4-phosphoerythronate dehydrogenase [Alteromonas sp. a30]